MFFKLQDVVFALAHATGKIGRFTLLERWRNNERPLAPTDNPLRILMKWGEYSSDVQFILQQTDQQSNKSQQQQHQQQQHQHPQNHIQSQQQIARQLQKKQKESDQSPQPSPTLLTQPCEDKNQNNIRRTTPTEGINDNKEIGIVKGIPQEKPPSPKILHTRLPSETSTDTTTTTTSSNIMPEYAFVNKKRPSEFKSADVRNSLDRKTSNVNQDTANLMEVFSVRTNNSLDVIKTPIGVSANGALVPPPYRNPPPPRSSPLNYSNCSSISDSSGTNNNSSIHSGISDASELNELLINNAQYKDLLQLIKFQREKISLQQADLTKVSLINLLRNVF